MLEVEIHPGWKISLRDLEGVVVSGFSSRLVQMPGWKSETKIRFPRAGNEQHGGEAQDLVFVVEEKSDDVFSQEGNDLYCRVRVSLVEALAGRDDGGKVVTTVELLDGRKMQVVAPLGVIKPG